MTPAERTIESATATDLPRLRTIQQRVLAEPTPELLAAAVEGVGLALVARPSRSAEPVGYVLALSADDIAYVPELAVDPDWQRQGIGTALLDAVEERASADGAAAIRLTVRAEDETARAFYRSCGFEVLEERPDYYDTGSGTGLVLGRSL